MIAGRLVREGAALVVPGLIVVLLVQACGGGGGSGSGSGSNGGGGGGGGRTQPPGLATPTREPTAPPTLIVPPGESIADTAKTAPAGTTIVVSPGLYAPVVFSPGDIQDGIFFFADVTGELTGTSPAPVVIDAQGQHAAVELSGQSDVTFDGFTLRGGTLAGILVKDSPGTFVEDCIISGNSGDGVRLQGADGGLIFNNLITNSGGAGIRVLATTDLQIINNTIYHSTQTGLTVGTLLSDASSNISVENNIFNRNKPSGMGIVVDTSTVSYQGDFNLNTDGYDGTAAGPNDLNADPLFILPANGDPSGVADFHLAAPSSHALDAGDPNIDAGLASALEQLTTQTDGTPDTPPLDMGYHYPAPVQPPTPAPKATHTGTPRPGTPRPGTPTATRRPTTPGSAHTATPTPIPTTTPKGPHRGTPTLKPTLTPKH